MNILYFSFSIFYPLSIILFYFFICFSANEPAGLRKARQPVYTGSFRYVQSLFSAVTYSCYLQLLFAAFGQLLMLLQQIQGQRFRKYLRVCGAVG